MRAEALIIVGFEPLPAASLYVARRSRLPTPTLDLSSEGCEKPAFLVPQLARVFAREKPDIVHSRNWATIEAVAAAQLARVPVVIHSEHGRDLQPIGSQPLRRRVLRRLSYAWADRVFCVSQELKNYYCRELGVAANELEVIPEMMSNGFPPIGRLVRISAKSWVRSRRRWSWEWSAGLIRSRII